ncbi:DNA cytosine methyltransferase, partial [Acinetobacter baumannii]
GQVSCTVLSNGNPGYGVPMVACVALRGRTQGLAAELGGSVAAALRTSGGGADKPHVLARDFEAHFRYDWNESGAADWS